MAMILPVAIWRRKSCSSAVGGRFFVLQALGRTAHVVKKCARADQQDNSGTAGALSKLPFRKQAFFEHAQMQSCENIPSNSNGDRVSKIQGEFQSVFVK